MRKVEHKKLISGIQAYEDCNHVPKINKYKNVKSKVYDIKKEKKMEKSVLTKEIAQQNQERINGFIDRMEKVNREKNEKRIIVEQFKRLQEEELYNSIKIKANLRANIKHNERSSKNTIKPSNLLRRRNLIKESKTSFKTVNILSNDLEKETKKSGEFLLELDEYTSLNFITDN